MMAIPGLLPATWCVMPSSAINTETDWTNATPVTTGIPIPQVAGSSEHMTVNGLVPGTTLFFGVRARIKSRTWVGFPIVQV